MGFKSNTPPKGDSELASFFFGEYNFVIHFFEQGSRIDDFFPSGSKTDEIVFTLSADTEIEVQEFEIKVKESGGEIFQKYAGTKIITMVLHLLTLMVINLTYY
ncbi:MAG: hypothetical protein ABIN97_04130 [Ginsengibacter sp.]